MSIFEIFQAEAMVILYFRQHSKALIGASSRDGPVAGRQTRERKIIMRFMVSGIESFEPCALAEVFGGDVFKPLPELFGERIPIGADVERWDLARFPLVACP